MGGRVAGRRACAAWFSALVGEGVGVVVVEGEGWGGGSKTQATVMGADTDHI